MMLRKRVRVADVAPFLFLGCTPFLIFILLVTPLDSTYAQDDSGEIFWGEDEDCLLYTSPSPRDQRGSGVGGCG